MTRRVLSTLALACSLAALTPAHASESATFAGTGSSQFYGFEIDFEGVLTGSVMSVFTGSAGYDITSVTVDGISILDLLPGLDDYYTFSLAVGPGAHTLSVKGISYGGQYIGAYTVTPVPEPAAGTLGLAGVAALGWLVTRRRRS